MKRIICLTLGGAFALLLASCTETVIIERPAPPAVVAKPKPQPKPAPKPAPRPVERAEDFEPVGKPQ